MTLLLTASFAMNDLRSPLLWLLLVLGVPSVFGFQPPPDAPAKPTEHILGAVESIDAAGQSMVVKMDQTAASAPIDLSGTRTILKVPPGAKDLKTASRITFSDLAVGDRVDVRGMKSSVKDGVIAARSVVVMSGADLKQKHEAEQAEWKASTPGTVTSVDPSSSSFVIRTRGEQGIHEVSVHGEPGVQYTRFSVDSPDVSVRSDLSQLHPGDQVRVIGTASGDGSRVQATKVYSGTFRTITGRVTTVAADGTSLALEQLQPRESITITLNKNSNVRRLPPAMAAALAGRASGAHASSADTTEANPDRQNARPAAGRSHGDLSRMLDRLPPDSISDIKLGDMLLVTGSPVNGTLVATTIVAGVEPILQASPGRQGRPQPAQDWSLDMNLPAQ